LINEGVFEVLIDLIVRPLYVCMYVCIDGGGGQDFMCSVTHSFMHECMRPDYDGVTSCPSTIKETIHTCRLFICIMLTV
jgi:hypothetical protein